MLIIQAFITSIIITIPTFFLSWYHYILLLLK